MLPWITSSFKGVELTHFPCGKRWGRIKVMWPFGVFFFLLCAHLIANGWLLSCSVVNPLLPSPWLGEFVAQFKFTVLLMPNGPMRITSGPFEPEFYKSEFEVQDADLKVSNNYCALVRIKVTRTKIVIEERMVWLSYSGGNIRYSPALI